jgi:hypothetical protein
MPGSGTRTFLKPDHYEASLRRAQIRNLLWLPPASSSYFNNRTEPRSGPD